MYSVDIVIPTYKRTDLLERCLESLSKINIPKSVNNVWVVENGPIGSVNEVVKKYSRKLPVKYLYLEVGNLSLARNRGIASSKADIIIFFDNDLRFEQDTLVAYIEGFAKYGSDCFYGGALSPDYETLPPNWLVKFLPPSAKGFDLGDKDKIISTPSFLGGNGAFFRTHLINNNGYDEYGAEGFNSGAVGEETRLQKRLLKQGLKGVYLPEARVLHYVPSDNCSIPWLLKRAERYGHTLALEEKPKIKKNTLMGIPYFHWMKMLKISLELLRCRVFSVGRAEGFEVTYKFHFQKGVLKGYKNTL